MTALEPILRACDGTWIASARATRIARIRGRARSPARSARQTGIHAAPRVAHERGGRRAIITDSRTKGSGRSATSRTRGRFSAPSDWQSYQDANRKFADAVLEEMAGIEHALLLVQDYHFALLPRMVKEARPDVRVAIFWHIPWPNPEAFGICPWQRELARRPAGRGSWSGFHIQAHCNNFLETVDAALESRIEWERFAVKRGGHITFVRPFPISVDFRERRTRTGSGGQSPYDAARRAAQESGDQGETSSASASTGWTTRRELLERFRGSRTVPRKVAGLSREIHVRADRRAQPHEIPRYHDFWGAGSRSRAHQCTLADRGLEAHSAAHAPSQPRRNSALLPGR